MSFEPFDPLEPYMIDNATRRVAVRNIVDSYHGNYDVLAEPLQNAVDAIEERYLELLNELGTPPEYRPEIRIKIDLVNNEITISDNGVGMNEDRVKHSLSPNFTSKAMLLLAGGRRLRGQKGLGMKYLAYGFDYFRLSTKKDGYSFSGELRDGKRWAFGDDVESPPPRVSPSTEGDEFFRAVDKGTCVTVRCSSITRPRDLSSVASTWAQWSQILRIHTAIGLVDLAGTEDWYRRARVILTVVNSSGAPEVHDVKFSFLYPHEVEGYRFLDLADYFGSHSERATIPPRYLHRHHGIHRIWNTEELQRLVNPEAAELPEGKRRVFDQNHPIVYGFFSHGARLWEVMNESTVGRRRGSLKPGVVIATENMPVGRELEVILEYAAGNKDRILVVAQLTNARPDVGRKGFSPEVEETLQDCASRIVRYFVENRNFLISAGVSPGSTGREREVQEAIDEASAAARTNPLSWPQMALQRQPHNEQEVIELFSEAIAKQIVRGFKIHTISQRDTYDAVVSYELSRATEGAVLSTSEPLGVPAEKFGERGTVSLQPRILEYKQNLDLLIGEFESEDKRFQDIKWVVVWEAGTRWRARYTLYSCLDPEFAHFREFHGVTHILQPIDRSDFQIHVIILKDLRDFLLNGETTIALQRTSYSNAE